MKSRFLIAAPSSNSGKTTITLGLLRLLQHRGNKVQPFKCGPDYIDTRLHTQAAGTESINLDTFMMSDAHVKSQFCKYGNDADVLITEGVMGLFDGADRMKGSSAEIAMLLDLPVILVINAKAMAYSVAPLLYGFKHFNPSLQLAGVIFNFVNSASHYQFLKEACEDVGVEALGYVPADDSLKIPSRHLGLSLTQTNDYDRIAEHIGKTVDVEKLLQITLGTVEDAIQPAATVKGSLRIAIARDEAFNFTYHENLAVLQQQGEVVFFSPLHDHILPAADLIYLAGGYPELYLDQLSGNSAMRHAILAYCGRGGRLVAECGGMMYLGKTIEQHEMVGFLDIRTTMGKLHLGYRTVEINGRVLKGHEFHYSTCEELSQINNIAVVKNARGMNVDTPVYKVHNVQASYIHCYWGEAGVIFE